LEGVTGAHATGPVTSNKELINHDLCLWRIGPPRRRGQSASIKSGVRQRLVGVLAQAPKNARLTPIGHLANLALANRVPAQAVDRVACRNADKRCAISDIASINMGALQH